MTSHDAHYKHLEAQGICVIEEMEKVMEAYFPDQPLLCRKALNSALARKYHLRAGNKDDFVKDMDKMANYLFRANTGRWPWDVVC
jgi:hypothetical protein